MLKRGSRGEKVRNLQYLLNANLFPDPNLGVDGVFGSGTEAAVRRFQWEEGLTVNGTVGPETWFELGDLGVEELPQCGGAIPGWMHIALNELKQGVREVPGEKKHNPRIVEYHQTATLKKHRSDKDENAWCSSFANWCMQRSGLSGTGKPNARSWLKWGAIRTQPQYGCVVVFWREARNSWKGHVGFYVGQRSAKKLLVLGGNQGNAVSIGAYRKARVLGYRWPS